MSSDDWPTIQMVCTQGQLHNWGNRLYYTVRLKSIFIGFEKQKETCVKMSKLQNMQCKLKRAGRNSPLPLFFVAATGSKEKIAQEEENKDRLDRSWSK